MTAAALLDVNVLLALAWPNHQHHGAAHAWFKEASQRPWATCALTQLGFVRLSSNPAFTSVHTTPKAAASLLQKLTAHQGHHYWPELPVLQAAAFERALGHQQVMDAYLVHLAEHKRGKLATFDKRLSTHATKRTSVVVISG